MLSSSSLCRAAFGASALIASLLPCLAAHADIKVVSETTFTGASGAPAPITSTVYYKGEKQRTEAPNRVTIYDCPTDTLYSLNPTAKTYTVSTGSSDVAANTGNPLLSMTKFETKTAQLSVVPGTKTVAGKPATDYMYILVLHVGPADASLADFIPSFTVTIKGDQWATETMTTPANCARMARLNLTRALPASVASMGASMKDLTDKASQIKGLFLSSRAVFTLKADAKAPDTGFQLPKDPITVTNEVTTISEDPLDDSLFTVPADYKKVDAAAKPVPAPAAAPAVSGTTTK